MRYVVAYDVADARLRERVANLLSGYGLRVQESVFECQLTDSGRQELLQKLAQLVPREGTFSVRIYRVCRQCAADSWVLGENPGVTQDDPCIIV